MIKPDLWVIPFRLGCRQEDDFTLRMKLGLGQADQFPADALLLAGDVHREIGYITTVAEIGQRPGNTHQNLSVPRRTNQVRMSEHFRNTFPIVNRAAFSQRGSLQDINKLRRGNLAIVGILNVHREHILDRLKKYSKGEERGF